MRCQGRVAIVTGAAGQGMGRSIALTLAREGAQVAVNYRSSDESAQAIAAHIVERGGAAIAVRADVFEPQGCRYLVERTVDAFGQVDICVIGPGAGWHPEPPHQVDAVGALRDVEQELAPIYHLMRLVLPGMYERAWGRLIALSLEPGCGSPAYAYNVGKAARTHALLLARDEAWRHGVTVNVIGPGPVPGIGSLKEAVEQCDGGPAWKGRKAASPQDVAEGVAFLCSDAGQFVSGCVLTYM
jgi:NAD(P)-dependent dehydrogenase (short-subunit alcohol dehydrogenase family)